MSISSLFEKAILKSLEGLQPGAILLAAISGGADSTAMLHALVKTLRSCSNNPEQMLKTEIMNRFYLPWEIKAGTVL
ncbi:MAG: hypothetical protein LBV68_08270, partial [Spirochaetaceae bacterium]|nr:hypothetical protein [Spirochaetaceae bacterium]